MEPVGWGLDPGFLVTRYQHGELVHRTIDRAVTGWNARRSLEGACAEARHMARWLGVFRTRGTRSSGGLTPAAYLEEMQGRAAEVGSLTASDPAMTDLIRVVESHLERLDDADVARMSREYPSRGDARPKNFLMGVDGVLYALDMEGFGYGPMEHDISCMHHALEYDGVRTRAAARRAAVVWRAFWDEYARHGGSAPFALLGYLYFLLDLMTRTTGFAARSRLPRRLVLNAWLRNRLRWLSGLSGSLEADVRYLSEHV